MILKLCSVILGFLLGYLLVTLYFPNNPIHGPDSNQIKREIYFDQSAGSCYQMIPEMCICPIGSV